MRLPALLPAGRNDEISGNCTLTVVPTPSALSSEMPA